MTVVVQEAEWYFVPGSSKNFNDGRCSAYMATGSSSVWLKNASGDSVASNVEWCGTKEHCWRRGIFYGVVCLWKKLHRAQVLIFWASARLLRVWLFVFILFHFIQYFSLAGTANLLLIAVICKRIKLDINKLFLDFFVWFLVVACPMKLKQSAQICAWSSTASEARYINLERHGHRT